MSRPATKKSKKAPAHAGGLPSKQAILDYLQSAEAKTGKRELAKAFGIKGSDRAAFKDLLREMADEGLLERTERKGLTKAGALPPVTVLEIIDRDTDGELLARPANWTREEDPPRIIMAPGEGTGKRNTPAIGIGDRVLARLAQDEEGVYEARLIKRLGQSAHRILGVFERIGSGRKAEGRVTPVDRKSRHSIIVPSHDIAGAVTGELVLVELQPSRLHGAKRGRVIERLCDRDDQGAISLIAVHTHGIPTDFPADVVAETEKMKPVPLGKRTDLRQMPLVTIDPEDARDHDDAVYAEPDQDPKNPGGHVVTVAIADVSAYVRTGSALDKEARKRGNSTYLPDRVIPMLPERLSADLCSLHEGEDKACLAVRMVFAADGRKRSHSFMRGLMCSQASLNYDQVRDAIEGRPDKIAKPLLKPVIEPLFAAYRAVSEARDKRQPLDLDLDEHKVEVGPDGRVTGVSVRERHDAHRLIEEFMILANVCAAETLERRKVPLLYRIHDSPDREKLRSLSEFLETVGLNLSKGQIIQPKHFNGIISKAQGTEAATLICEVILRAQSQAQYNPDNIGHFGLNLRRYAHFTSPIRRYADLIVHRGLVRACGLGQDGLEDTQAAELETIGSEISGHERRSMAAERDSVNRFIASYMQDKVGTAFDGRICGVTRFGLFVKLDDTGADGLVPIRSLGDEHFTHDEDAHALIGERSGAQWRLGDPVEVRIEEAAPMTGGLRFSLLSDPTTYVKTSHSGRGKTGPKGPRGAAKSARRGKGGKKPKGKRGRS